MIKAIIVDDEHYAAQALVTLLERHCADVKVEAVCNSATAAMEAIEELQPQLVFLDIEMPHLNGFELLEKMAPIQFDFIFTTSYNQYAIKAIRFSALDYLLKPIDKEELIAAVNKFINRRTSFLSQQLDILLAQLRQPQATVNRIALPTLEGLQLIPVDTIIYCTSNSNYTILFLKENQKLTVSRTLKEIEEMLEDYPFLRVHHSYLVNLNEIRKYIKGEGGSLVMSNSSEVNVSRSKKEMLLAKLQANK